MSKMFVLWNDGEEKVLASKEDFRHVIDGENSYTFVIPNKDIPEIEKFLKDEKDFYKRIEYFQENYEQLERCYNGRDWLVLEHFKEYDPSKYSIISNETDFDVEPFDVIDIYEWQPAVIYWDGGNWKVKLFEGCEEIEVTENNTIHIANTYQINKIKYLNEDNEELEGYEFLSFYQGALPLFFDNKEDLEDFIDEEI